MLKTIIDLKKTTNFLGRVSVSNKDNHTIECRVNPSQLSSYFKVNGYFFEPKGNQQNVKYIIEGYIFKERLYVDTDASIDFIDCQILDGIDVFNADTIRLKNNRHFLFNKKNLRGDPYLITRDVKKVILDEEDLRNRNIYENQVSDFDIDLCADEIIVNDSQITTPEGSVSITAGDLEFTKSEITGKDVTLDLERTPESDLESKITAETLHWFGKMGSKVKVDFNKIDRKKEQFTKVFKK